VADIFLDTPLVNAHTSATDILWAGVPMLTMPRESMISRVAASLALAAGLDYMVVPTLSEYERLSVSLLGDGSGEGGEALSQMRANTIKAREESPLFDTQGWVTSLDSAMAMAWECALTGKTFHVIASKSV
jgi:protein O-GlcNAc transferase